MGSRVEAGTGKFAGFGFARPLNGKLADFRLVGYSRRSPLAALGMQQALIASLGEYIALIVLAWVVAGFVWQVFIYGVDGYSLPLSARPDIVTSGFPGLDTNILLEFDAFHRPRSFDEQGEDAMLSAPETNLNLILHGVRTGNSEAPGSAIIGTPGNKDTVFVVGQQIREGLRLKDVHATGIVLSRLGRREVLFLEGRDKSQVSSANLPAEAKEGRSDPTAESVNASGIAGVEDLLRQARLKPVWEGQDLVGYAIDPRGAAGSVRALGLEPNDIVVELNGSRITRQTDLFGRLEDLEEARWLDLKVLRAGVETSLRVQF